jgi:UDP-N-acetylglucosamine:LPS N-acetylglucosamine transferase
LDVLETLSSWLRNDHARLNEVAKNAEQLGKADAAREIAVEAWKLLRQKDN